MGIFLKFIYLKMDSIFHEIIDFHIYILFSKYFALCEKVYCAIYSFFKGIFFSWKWEMHLQVWANLSIYFVKLNSWWSGQECSYKSVDFFAILTEVSPQLIVWDWLFRFRISFWILCWKPDNLGSRSLKDKTSEILMWFW